MRETGRIRRRRAGLALATPCLVLAACGGDRGSACEPVPAGEPVVVAAESGRWERRGEAPRLVELWRRGGTREGEDLVFPVQVAAGPEGRVAVPDFPLGEVVVIGPDGTWEGAWAGRGDGPGEVRAPVAAVWDREGTLSLFDVAAAEVARLRDGAPVPGGRIRVDPAFVASAVAAGELTWAGVLPDGTVLLQPPSRAVAPEGREGAHRVAILRLAPGSTVPDTVVATRLPVVSTTGHSAWPVPGWPRPTAAVGAGGRLAVGAADGSYRIRIVGPGGAVRHVICRRAEPLPLGPAERGEAPASRLDTAPVLRELVEAVRAAARPDRPAPFGRIVLGARGRVWVQRERPPALPASAAVLHGRPGALHDVFEANGTWLGELRMPEGVSLQAARGDTVWGFATGAYDEVWVVAYWLELGSAEGS